MHRRNRHHRERVSDGQLDLVAEGRNRFEIVGVNQDRSFLQAEVLMIVDEPGAAPQEDTSRAVQLHSELLAIAGAKQISPPPTLRCFLFIWPALCPSIWISNRSYSLCAPKPNDFLTYYLSANPYSQPPSCGACPGKSGGNGHVR